MAINISNDDALKRKAEAIKADLATLKQHIATQAAAFSDDPAEQQDYRRLLLSLLISDALRPMRGAGEMSRRRVDVVLGALSKELKETAARRKRIEGLIADFGLAIDDAFLRQDHDYAANEECQEG